jgi:hypothetical protein
MNWVWMVVGLLHPAPVCEVVHPEPMWSGLAPVGELDSLVAEGPASLSERLEIERWREACPHDRPDAPVFALLGLLRLEKVLGVNRWRPGLLGAVWCVEAAWSKKRPLWGDWRGAHPMAHGPFQLWLSSRQTCSLTAEGAQDLAASARCWVMQVEALRAKAARVCRGDEVTLSRVAEAAVSNVRRYQWGCRYSSAHWKVAAKGLPDPPPVPRVSRP